MMLHHKAIWYAIPLHVWCLLYAWTQVFLFNGEHLLDRYDLSGLEQLLNLFLVGHVLVLKMDVISDVVRSQRVIPFLVLDPGVVHEGILEKLLEFAGEFDHFGF